MSLVPPSAPELSRKLAIVGLGESDYAADYAAARAKTDGYTPPTPERLTRTAFDRALVDSGLKLSDIDGLTVSYLYGGPEPAEVAQTLGVKPRYLAQPRGIMAGPLPQAAQAIAEGKADCIAMIYAVATRSIGRKFGGTGSGWQEGTSTPSSYYYHHPWGWSSQAAHWAFVWSRYQQQYGKREEDLAAVPIQLRKNAMANENAIMRKPISVEDYLASRYIVKPLHLLDLCLVNDGGVCLIVRRADMAAGLPNAPVELAGWGGVQVGPDKLRALVVDRLRPQFRAAGGQALGMAGLSLPDVGHFEGYDASSIHLINHLEGHGFVREGEGLDYFAAGQAALGGQLPTNLAGGLLSGSYMHGWGHIAEIVRQLRHKAGRRQIAGVETSMFSLAETNQVHPMIFSRGSAA